MNADAGRDAVARVRVALEPEHAVERPGGFRWWPDACAMDVWAEEARADGSCRVVVETALLSGLTGRGAEFAALARRNAREPGLSSLRLDVERGEVSLRASAIARPGDDSAAVRLLSHAALLQAGEAALAASALVIEFPSASLLTGTPAEGALESRAGATSAYALAAADSATRTEQPLAPLARISPAPWLRVTTAAHGLDAELACAPQPSAATGPGPRALLRMSAREQHPRLGPGLLTALAPPPEMEPVPERAAATAALLNEAEAREWTGFDQLGGWCVHAGSGLAHVSFVPAVALEAGTAERLAWQAGMRARWARAFLAQVAGMRAGRG
jgi:hypothetical protein